MPQVEAPYVISNTNGEEVISIASFIQRQLETALTENFGLTYAQFKTLDALYFMEGTASMGELADEISCTRGNMTGIIDRLERDGWVVRERDKEDRRQVQITLVDPVKFQKILELAKNTKLAMPIKMIDKLRVFVR